MSIKLSDRTLAYAEELTDAVLGLDALYREESGDEVGLAVLNLSPTPRTPESFSDYEDVVEAFSTLRDRAGDLPERDRRTYYQQFCDSMCAFAEWRQDGLPLSEQIERFLHVPADPPSTAELNELRAELSSVLDRLGYEGDAQSQCRAWKDATTVPAAEAPEVLESEMDRMRDLTLAGLDTAPENVDQIGAAGVSGASFNAKCDFANGEVVINTDPQLTRPWLRKLAVHEGYPGHVLQFSLRRQWYEDSRAPADGLLSVVNCASSTTFEGIADSGLALLDTQPEADHAASLVGRYQMGIATAAAWRYHAEDWPEQDVHEWLSEQAIYGDEEWVKSRVGFLTAPERATLMWSYWHGEPAVTSAIESVDPSAFDTFVEFLYGRMHSTESITQFDPNGST
ncbi:hypothetical protein EXE51_14855 [Halorubrum sp. CGM5_25_10-8B]|nr:MULTISPECIES: DUF885 domain-containing protein [Halorubrum]TKX35355.1 hypothetical protein EXE51_14855 [Halorubrum sp. CGM5_25_10-8B]